MMNGVDDSGHRTDSTEDHDEKILLAPYEYICQIPGKNVRSKLIAAFNYWLNIPTDKLKLVADVIQMLHNASLLIDDIEDHSSLRRGIPVAHNIFGVPHTINSANYVYFLGLQKAQLLNHPDVNKIFTEQLLDLHRGQGMDIYWRDANVCPTEEEYILMVMRKTGGLFGLGVKMMQLFSDIKSDFQPLIGVLGLYFQIRDDYANLNSKEYEANKSYAEDLTEGKFSFPIIHAIRSNPNDNQILSILRQRTTDIDVKKYCVDLMAKKGSFEYTKTKLKELEKSAYDLIAEHGGNRHLVALVDELKKIYQDNNC
ncbi:geranylgeranyl pyrophosphate synthase-like [Gigantopelta aegis]|uniref:geranylgeranyl pyrophosphate synthase-like n=1 Tax=Gigantopelta aegis TaxID=1735272 RepID=UPI001B88932F|nr:geranylgeranyl pyrophosphate synthase-like [Gigantopelta aegis]XP_041363257.1 geranylgeranyl pyrophosphate synthase-like [Gigantopelta aegis]XP_041363259.1 geranylgeranyl pyrophosphate synthase-like [Gigantopelta aegis]XP_041363260.1 geranylgeranyl pyrophosphate synthase-like [Gigantopelta aegis]